MKVLVLGSSGLIGSRFVELNKNNFEFLTPTSSQLDVTNFEALNNYFKNNSFDSVVNFVAFTDVASAELQRSDKEGKCWQLNVELVKNLSNICIKYLKYLLQLSTDFVFSGSADNKGPYIENSKVEADYKSLSWYGYTKALSESFISDTNGILRVSYPYKHSFNKKKDFARSIIDLFNNDKLYPLFTDQIITPSYIDEISKTIYKILTLNKTGIYHCASSNPTTPNEFASYLLELYAGHKITLQEASLVNFLSADKTRAKKPLFGGLDTRYTQNELDLKFATWQESVRHLTRELVTNT